MGLQRSHKGRMRDNDDAPRVPGTGLSTYSSQWACEVTPLLPHFSVKETDAEGSQKPGVTSLVVAEPGFKFSTALSRAQRGQNLHYSAGFAMSELEGNVGSLEECPPLRGR